MWVNICLDSSFLRVTVCPDFWGKLFFCELTITVLHKIIHIIHNPETLDKQGLCGKYSTSLFKKTVL